MLIRRSPLLWILGSLVVVTALPAAKPKKPTGPEVLVVSDLLVEESRAPRPTPEKPVYYFLLGGLERTLGDSIAGEPMPKTEQMTRELVAALATQGYRRTQLGGPMPTQALVFTFGSANLSSMDFSDTDLVTGETTTSTVDFNRREIAQLVGADKAARGFTRSSEAERVFEAARDDRVYVLVAAFDAADLAKKKKTLLWRTRVSIDSRRRTLPESLPIMLASAAPYFGKASDLPVFIEDADRRKTEVQVGAPVVVPTPPPEKP